MATDPFDDLLELENDYYKEGYDAGVTDSTYAGMIEGLVFGIEKGYEKAVELGKLHGRALVWQARFTQSNKAVRTAEIQKSSSPEASVISISSDFSKLSETLQSLDQLPSNSRLRKHVEALYATSNSMTMARDNSDEAVTEFDDRIAKARAKAKLIANIVGESPTPAANSNAGIEDATGLQAHH
ncbi:uncharacterized protein Z518_02331 [Rhinocladiella mackenziei CBS 650.93]|uniref:Rhinocladiella mackenziei CBS 650.93 unplaced genomic scaffold supercont1.2, whole genome shotgun sequence n=1 Tax=Rhinocladiella mackenziei CBS 650.93 TaxID=1442369 RepID=A0A0D2FZG0_9EURO|nr:uncharacterized protein Z518_02331 [Rhinocladiella mackenziei CBS 650.93]KIX07677.1 hypothetical protein Z518_02331 [Rhinocladiella mackenziei CBS 650.93]